jgi:UDP-N-acetyl-D-glucosamine dehydrogenase
MEEFIRNEKIAIVGLGYVGLPLALLADKKGYGVVGILRNQEKADLINKKTPPFKDDLIKELLPTSNLIASTDFQNIKDASIVIICVPTPVNKNFTPDLEPIKSASRNIGKNLQKGQLIILESTVNPGVSEDVVLTILEEESGLKAGVDFYLSHCPERINPGDPKWNVENINRVVGSLEEVGLEKTVNFYESILTGNIKKMKNLKEAEAVKVVENSFRDINIAFVNELAVSFSSLGIDVVNVIDGAATKPFAFMPHYPGCGVGGHCIPVDPYYLIEYAKTYGFDHDFLALARRINNRMPELTADIVQAGLNEIKVAMKEANVTVLGLAYKANIDDSRESPSFEIIRFLKKLGANVTVYDPYIPQKSTVQTLTEALDNADAVVIATNHKEFKELKPEDFISRNIKVIIDGRNCLPKEEYLSKGLIYKGIGR